MTDVLISFFIRSRIGLRMVHGCCFTRHPFSPFAVLLKRLLHIVIIHLWLLSRPTGRLAMIQSAVLIDHSNEGKNSTDYSGRRWSHMTGLAVRFMRQYCTGYAINLFLRVENVVYIDRCCPWVASLA